MNDHESHDELFNRVCDGLATAEEIKELHRLLRADAAALDAWLRFSALHGELAGGTVLASEQAPLRALPSRQGGNLIPMPRRNVWLQWRSLAAGLVFGLLSATMVWAYVIPRAGKVITLLQESFETAPPPLVTGVPIEPGRWSGDYSEIVGEQQGVKPASGRKMLRFLRADFEGKPSPGSSHLADMHQLIDLRPYRQEIADGGGVIEVSASFNAIPFPEDEKYGCAVSIFALDAELATNGSTRIGSTLMTDALAMTRSDRGRLLDRDPATWQRVTAELRLPPGADFVMVRLHIHRGLHSPGVTFAGHYADDVHVSLIRRAPLP